ncbi:hypothetical protein Esti_005659 [Eimeria stiedai]
MWFWVGTSGTPVRKEVTDVSKQDFYSADHLLALLDSLLSFQTIDSKNRDLAIEVLRQIAEVLVWGEQHNRGYFDIFCEQNVLSYFVKLAEQPAVPNAVKVQLLQTLSIIVQSINKETAVYYMFSNNYINTLLSTKFDFEDEEVASWYVSFIKSLSLLVNQATLKLFLNERAKHFPIYSEAVKFFIAKDSMIRTHCRNVTLSIFRIDDPALRAFLLARPIFFAHVACYLKELLDTQFSRLQTCGGTDLHLVIRDVICETEEMLYYIQDIFSLNVDAFSELLASRLLTFCYFPLIGLLKLPPGGDDDFAHGGDDVSADGFTHKSEGSEASSNVSSNGAESQSVASPRSSTEVAASENTDKRREQGWIWGWGSSEDFQDASSGGEAQDQKPTSFSSRAGDLSRCWRARAAQAMSGTFYEAREEIKASSESSDAVAGSSSAAPSVSTTRQPQTAGCDQQRRLIFFFLIQTFNCIQSEKLIRPIVVALLFQRLPRSLYDLLLARAPAVPSAYNRLRRPSQCAGNIERFLPAEEPSVGHQVERTDSRPFEHAEPSSRQRLIEDTKEESLSRTTTQQERQAADFSALERIQILKSSMDALHSLGVFKELDQSTGQRSSVVFQQHEETPRKASTGARRSGESHSFSDMGDSNEDCDNPFRHYLLSLLDGGQLAEAEDDSCLLLLSLLLHSVLRHPSVTEPGRRTTVCMPTCGLRAQHVFSSSLRTCVEPARSALDPTATQQRKSQDCDSTWEAADTLGSGGTIVSNHGLVLVGAPITLGDSALHSKAAPPSGVCSFIGSGNLSWSFTAQVLAAIQTHLVNPFLRPITVRVAISLIATLLADHVLKVQSVNYRLWCTRALVERVLQLRRSAAVATKLCLSALSDGHTIDVFWDEWETHRFGALDDLSLCRDARILDFPNGSRAGKNSTALPPYLLVAVTDQEVERRSVQLFLLFRRLHRDLSKILHSVKIRSDDVVGVAHEASSLLAGESPEPNPFESEDDAEQIAQTVEGLPLEGRNIIRCTVETSSGPAIRYCVQDDKRLLLVSPSSTRPGVADIKTSHPLRNVECRLKKNGSRSLQLFVLDVTPPADGPLTSSLSSAAEKPPTMQVSLTAPPLNGEAAKERPALWEIRLQFADVVRCNTVFRILQHARARVRKTLASHIDALLEETC